VLQLSLLSVFCWISWTACYDVTKIRPHAHNKFLSISALKICHLHYIGKNAKPENPVFRMTQTWVFGFGKRPGYPGSGKPEFLTLVALDDFEHLLS